VTIRDVILVFVKALNVIIGHEMIRLFVLDLKFWHFKKIDYFKLYFQILHQIISYLTKYQLYP
jgi:hypothetical protein